MDDPTSALAHTPPVPDLAVHPTGLHDAGPPTAPITSVTHIQVGDNIELVSAPATHVQPDAGDAPSTSHHGLVDLAKDTGWLAPTAPPMAFAGMLFTGFAGKRLKRLAGIHTDDLHERVASGERVVVAVDADELDRGLRGDDRLHGVSRIPGQQVERAVEVVFVDRDRARVTVDYGVRGGRQTVELTSFEAAWRRTGGEAFVAGDDDSGRSAAP